MNRKPLTSDDPTVEGIHPVSRRGVVNAPTAGSSEFRNQTMEVPMSNTHRAINERGKSRDFKHSYEAIEFAETQVSDGRGVIRIFDVDAADKPVLVMSVQMDETGRFIEKIDHSEPSLWVTIDLVGRWELWKRTPEGLTLLGPSYKMLWKAERQAEFLSKATGWPIEWRREELHQQRGYDGPHGGGADKRDCGCNDCDPCQKCGKPEAEDVDCGMGGEQHLCYGCARVEAPHMFPESDPS